MAVPHSVDPVQLLEKHLVSASPDLLREMIATFANAMMSAQADQVCGAGYGERSDQRVNRRNGYRAREWDTRVGTVELAIPKLREGSYYPDWLLTPSASGRAGVGQRGRHGLSVGGVDAAGGAPGRAAGRQVVVARAGLGDGSPPDAQVSAFRERPLDAGPDTFVWADALTVKVREDGRVVNVHALVATGVNADGHREILGLDVASAEDGAGWLAFWRGLVARGLSGVQLVTADAHCGLVAAIGAALPGATWQRCRSHYLRTLLTKVPKSAQPHAATQVRTIFDQADDFLASPKREPIPFTSAPAQGSVLQVAIEVLFARWDGVDCSLGKSHRVRR